MIGNVDLMVKNVTQNRHEMMIAVEVNVEKHWNKLYMKKIMYATPEYVLASVAKKCETDKILKWLLLHKTFCWKLSNHMWR